jgi:glycosyltransferase involved in cell wall biosynthesis
MKIAVVHNQPSGGARRALHGFCRELSARNTVEVFMLSTADRGLLDAPARVYAYAPREPIRFGLYLNDWRRRLDLRDLVRVYQVVARDVDDGGFDVVLADVDRFVGAPFVLRYLRTPAAYYCHEPPRALYETAWRPHLTPYQRLRRVWRAALEHPLARKLAEEERSLVRTARLVCTNSRYTRSRIEAIYGVKAVVCPPGVDVPALDVPPPASAGYVLSVGALEPHKGFDFLVAALARVPRDARPALHIISNDQNPSYRREIERAAREAGVKLRIRLRVPQDELDAEYAAAAVFVFAAHDEPLGLAPLEAMAHALPVVAISEGGVNETVIDGETGLLVPRDREAFGIALQSLLASRERRGELGANGRRIALARWNWPERAAALEAQLEALAGGTRDASSLTGAET